MKTNLPQQSLFLLRSLLAKPVWARTYKEQYVGGRLLAERLPEPNVDWVKSPKQLEALSPDELEKYRNEDRAWAATPIEIEISDQEREICRKCIEKLIESGEVGCSPFMFHLLEAFGFRPE